LEDHIGAGFNWYIFHYLKFSFLRVGDKVSGVLNLKELEI
jgi:hypothetical protein